MQKVVERIERGEEIKEEEIEKLAEEMSWEEFYKVLSSYSVKMEETEKKERILEGKLKVAKQLLQEYSQNPNKIGPELYIKLTEFVKEVEKRLKEAKKERRTIIVLFKIALAKLRKERLAFRKVEPKEDENVN